MMADHHPEELIDRARQGALDAAEHSTLDQHLAVCHACAALLAQEAEVERELAMQPRDEILDQRAVEAAMLRIQRSSPLGRSRAWPRSLRLAAAGVLLASGLTATAAIVGRRLSSRAPVDATRSSSRAPGGPFGAGPVPAPIEVPEPPEAPPPIAVPPRSAPVRPAITAAALFERAGNLRREGRVDAAIAAYRRLQETFPDAREAQALVRARRSAAAGARTAERRAGAVRPTSAASAGTSVKRRSQVAPPPSSS